MSNGTDPRAEAEAILQRIVEQASDEGATTIEFERVPEGLEIIQARALPQALEIALAPPK